MKKLQKSYEYFKVFEAQLQKMEEKTNLLEERVCKLENVARKAMKSSFWSKSSSQV